MNRAQSHRRRGYSLVELVMVMALIAIIAALAAPRWVKATQHYAADLAAQRVAGDIALAQSRANFSSTSVTISFATPGRYQISGMSDPNKPSQTYTVDLTASPYTAALSNINFGGTTSLTFDGYGVPKQSGSLLVSVAGWSRTVSVDGTSGKVSIQ